MLANWPWRLIAWQVSSSPKSFRETLHQCALSHFHADRRDTVERKRWTEEEKFSVLCHGNFRTACSDRTYLLYDWRLILTLRSNWHVGLAFRCVCSHYVSGRDNLIPQLGVYSEDGAALMQSLIP
jgi:hypothetical protein